VQLKSLPPCIVLGLETQIALGVVRELGRAGVPVIGIAQSPFAIGLKSRFLSRGIVVDKPRSEAMLTRIRELGEEYGDICLLTVSEVNLNWLIKNKHALGKVRPILPKPEAISIVLDKQKTLAIAKAIGIDIPITVEPESIESVSEAATKLRFPVVLKWKDPNAVGSLLSASGIAMHKAEYALDAEQLLAIGQRYLPIGKWPLIQEYCPGVGLGQFFYMHQGQDLRRFQHVRIAEWPPEGGFSSVCDSVPLSEHVALQEKSIELLRIIGWEGVAMVEYRFDPTTRRAVLMEINGRFWGSFPLAVHCRVGFALLAYSVQGLGQSQLPGAGQIDNGIRCRMVVTEIKRLVRIVFQPSRIKDPLFKVRPFREIARFVLDFMKPNVRYYLWANDDPGPFFRDITNVFFRRN
jgi:predicted ATP-grasp superfamily ATP-dependent carboligase